MRQASASTRQMKQTRGQLSQGNFDVATSTPYIGDFQSIESSLNSFTATISDTFLIIVLSLGGAGFQQSQNMGGGLVDFLMQGLQPDQQLCGGHQPHHGSAVPGEFRRCHLHALHRRLPVQLAHQGGDIGQDGFLIIVLSLGGAGRPPTTAGPAA